MTTEAEPVHTAAPQSRLATGAVRTTNRFAMGRSNTLLRLSVLTFIACAIWLIGLGGYFIFARPPLLSEDLRYLHVSADQIAMHMALLTSWLDKVFFVPGGFIAGGGCLLLFVAIYVLPQRLPVTGGARVLPLGVLLLAPWRA